MQPGPLCFILLIFAAAPAAAADGAIRLFTPAPKSPAPLEQSPVEQTEVIRLFSRVSSAARPDLLPAPVIRGAVREKVPAQAPPADRGWTIALP